MFRTAFKEANSGGVAWKRVPEDWVLKNLSGVTVRYVNELILDHITDEKRINEVDEVREDWKHCKKHYDFIISVDGRDVYVETTIVGSKMGPIVTVVSAHDP